MGNKSTSQPSVLSNNYSWESLEQKGPYTIVRCDNTGAIGQMYRVNIDQWNQEIAKYQFRKDNDEFLVGIYSVTKDKSQFICSTTQIINVVTERMPYCYADFDKLQYQEALYALLQVISGMKLIYELNPLISFDQQHVLVNQKGEVKVWINRNLGLNISQNRQQISEKQLINKIFSVVQNHILVTSIPQQYYQLKDQFKPQTFSSALFFLKRIKFQHAPHSSKLSLAKINKQENTMTKLPAKSKQTQKQTNNVQSLMPDSQVTGNKLANTQSTQQSNENSAALSEDNSRLKPQQTQITQQKLKNRQLKPPLPPNRTKSKGKASKSKQKPLQTPKIVNPNQPPLLLPNSPRPLNRENSQKSLSKERIQIVNSPRNLERRQSPNFVISIPITKQQTNQGIEIPQNMTGIRTRQDDYRKILNNSTSRSIQKRKTDSIQKSIGKVIDAHPMAQKIAFNQHPSLNKAPKINFTFESPPP